MSIEREQRYTRDRPCPICGGNAHDHPHCHGFLSDSGAFARCSNEDGGGLAKRTEKGITPTYVWRREDNGTYRPWTEQPPLTPIRAKKSRNEAHGANTRHNRDAANTATVGQGDAPTGHIVATYAYRDEEGVTLFEVVRYADPKDFRQRHPNGRGGYVWNLRSVRLVPYRLPELLAADPTAPVFIPEGEKDADALAALGIVATTNAMGAGKWRDDYTPHVAGRHVIVLPDNDAAGREGAATVARSLFGTAASVSVFTLPGLPDKGDVSDWLAAGGDAHTLLALAATAPAWEPTEDDIDNGEDADAAPVAAGPYVVDGGRICRRKHERDGSVSLVPLCNFTAAITEQVTSDNGAETRGELTIAGAHMNGTPFPPARVSLTEYPTMNWPLRAWGAAAVVTAGMGAKDQLREAIQLLSPQNVFRTEYTHTGWRRIEGEHVYLHAGGAIGAGGAVPDMAVRLSDALAPFALPEPPEGDALHEAVRASLAVLDVAPDAVTVPLLAAAYRAPLCIVDAADTTVALIGSTGAGKSELAALPQQHFGAGFERRKLPGSWESTPNALGWLLFEAKDALAVIDDFKPGGTQQDAARLHQAADRVIRGVGNGAGRGRMRADGGLRAVTPPRGLLLITGEESPRGESLAARMTTVPVDRGAVDFARLTDTQAHGAAGRYAAAMAGYLRWLAPRLDTLTATAATDRAALRDAARRDVDAHARTPDAVATLAYGWRQWLAFALDVGAISEREHATLWGRVWAALVSVGRAQREHVAHEEPTARFFALLNTALASWQAHIADASGQAPFPPEAFGWKVIVKDEGGDTDGGGGERRVPIAQGKRIGWVDGDHLYLDAQAAHAAAQRVATETNGPVLIPPGILSRRLHERGLLRSAEPSRFGYAVRKVLEGKRRPVLHLHVGVLNPEHDHHDHDDRAAPDSPPYEGERAVGASGKHDQTGQKHDPGGHAAPSRGHSANGVGGENVSDAGGGGHGGHGGHASGPYTSHDNEQGREGGDRPARPAVPITDAAREIVQRVRLERPDAPPARVEQIAQERLRWQGYDPVAVANALWEVMDAAA